MFSGGQAAAGACTGEVGGLANDAWSFYSDCEGSGAGLHNVMSFDVGPFPEMIGALTDIPGGLLAPSVVGAGPLPYIGATTGYLYISQNGDACDNPTYPLDGVRYLFVEDGDYVCAIFSATGLEAGREQRLSAQFSHEEFGFFNYYMTDTLIPWALTTSTAGDGTAAGAGDYVVGATVNLTHMANTGSTFSSWSGHADCADSFTMPDEDVSCTANFSLNSYAITETANPVAGGSVSCTPNPVDHGSNASCAATPNPDYSFEDFGGDCSGATCALTNVTSTKAVTGNFTLNDLDSDDVLNDDDNCPTVYNPNQTDSDNDNIGNVCDLANDCVGPEVIIEATTHVDNVYCADGTSITAGGAEPFPGSVNTSSTGNVIYTAPEIILVPQFSVESGAMFRADSDLPAHNQCTDDCVSINAICEDGGPGAVASSCTFGTDCTDCGVR